MKKIALIESYALPANSGEKTLIYSFDLFAKIDSDFEVWGFNPKKCTATPVTHVDVYQVSGWDPEELFRRINPNLDLLVMTQSQIRDYLELYADALPIKDGILFLTKSENGQEFGTVLSYCRYKENELSIFKFFKEKMPFATELVFYAVVPKN